MFGSHEQIGSKSPLTIDQIHDILSAIEVIREAEEQLEAKLREAGLNPWATHVAGHSGSKRGIVSIIEATLILEEQAAQRREEMRATLVGIVDASTSEVDQGITPDTTTVEQQISECFEPIEL